MFISSVDEAFSEILVRAFFSAFCFGCICGGTTLVVLIMRKTGLSKFKGEDMFSSGDSEGDSKKD